MTDQIPIPSPCVGVCELDLETGLCRGCLRNGEEIGAWGNAGEAERREIIRRIEARRAAGVDTRISERQRFGG
jgi:hypothetical protein